MNQILGFIDLHKGEEDKAKVLDNVVSNTSFRGANLWILACAITNQLKNWLKLKTQHHQVDIINQ